MDWSVGVASRFYAGQIPRAWESSCEWRTVHEKASSQFLSSGPALRGFVGQRISGDKAELRSFGAGVVWGATAVCGHAFYLGGLNSDAVLSPKRVAGF